MKNEDVVIYACIDVTIQCKMYHQKYSAMNKRNKRRGIGWCNDSGDIPTAVFSNGKFREVVNNRGRAYALRNAKKFRRKYYNSKRLPISQDDV
jgi:hypothetical protein